MLNRRNAIGPAESRSGTLGVGSGTDHAFRCAISDGFCSLLRLNYFRGVARETADGSSTSDSTLSQTPSDLYLKKCLRLRCSALALWSMKPATDYEKFARSTKAPPIR